MVGLNENLNKKISPRLSAIAFGDKHAKLTIEEMRKKGPYEIDTIYVSSKYNMASDFAKDIANSDLLYVVMDENEVTERNLSLIKKIIADIGSFAIGICIGNVFPTEEKNKLESIMKVFYVEEDCRIHRYIAMFTEMLDKAIQPETLVGIGISDLQLCLGNNNRIWFGKAYGKDAILYIGLRNRIGIRRYHVIAARMY